MGNDSTIQALWGKKAANGEPRWLPLVVHLAVTYPRFG